MLSSIPLPPSFNRYMEPFAGGLAMYASLPDEQVKGAIIGDTNVSLCRFYTELRDNAVSLLSRLLEEKREFDNRPEEERLGIYLGWRDEFNTSMLSSQRRATLFYLLNRTGFNGLWRVNAKGVYNVPYDRARKEVYLDVDLAYGWHERLSSSRTIIENVGFGCPSIMPQYGDFVFADPPYWGVFDKYGADGFGAEGHRNLSLTLRSLSDQGVSFCLTNTDAPEVREMYKGFNFTSVVQNNAINSRGSGRKGGRVDLIVTNY
jgi:DNA adenine methylase